MATEIAMDTGQQIFQFLTEPNVAYVLLIVGLWLLVLALTTPGTGIAEVAAAIALLLAAIGLFRMTVSLAGLLLILLAFALFAADVFAATHGALTVGGVLALLGGSFLLFPGRAGAGGVSGWLVAGVTLGSAGISGLVLHGLVRSLRRPRVELAAHTVEGEMGQVRTAITPGEGGTIQVAGQLWSATADEPIEAGAKVVVKRRQGLTLYVARAASGSAAPRPGQTQ